jgi:RecA-family ATPase
VSGSFADKLRTEILAHEARAAEARRDLAELIGEAGEDIRPVQIGEALAEPHPAEEWVINGLLPVRCIGLLSAEGGVGKSTLAAQVCAGLSSGQGFFGFDCGTVVPTLFLEAEGSREKFVERIGVALSNLAISPDDLPLFVQPKTWRPSLNGTTADTIRVCGARLVVLDTIGLFQPFDENSATEFKALILGPLRRLAEETGAAFLLIHHQGKPSEMRKGRHKVRGTSAFVDDTDLAMRLEAPDGDKAARRVLTFDKVRHGSPHEDIELEYDMATATFRLSDPGERADREASEREARDRVKVEKMKARIIAELKKEALDSGDLQKVLNARKADVVLALTRMSDEKLIYHEAAGQRGTRRVWKVFNDV